MLNIFFLIHFKMVRSDVVCMCVGGGGVGRSNKSQNLLCSV